MLKSLTPFLMLLLAALPWAAWSADTAPTDPYQVRPLLPGMNAPAFKVQRADGSVYDFTGKPAKPVVLTFYRGGWCPYCNLHLGEMSLAEAKLIEMGYEVIFISPDRPEVLYPSLKEENINYTLLSDSKMQAAQAFGIAFTLDDKTLQRYKSNGIDLAEASGEDHHMLPVPAVFVIGTDGMIHFQYVNPDYKVRLHPDVLLTAARVALQDR